MVKMSKVLVTGGAGFIGSHLVDRLLSEGYRVAVVDDLSGGSLKNLNPAVTFYHTDLAQPSFHDIFSREEPDVVFHLAARVSVTGSIEDPVDNAEVNVLGTLRLLEAARRNGIEKLIYSSTGGAIYGNPQSNPCSEDTPALPLSPYGLSKRIAEEYIDFYHHHFRLNHTILRYGNVYGPRQDPRGEAGVIAIFSQTMLEGRQPIIYGDGEQERDFIYVDDVVEANMQAINRGHNQIFNIGAGEGVSINRIFHLLREGLNYPQEAKHRPHRPSEVHKIFLDCARARQHLRWEPRTSLAEGLRQTLEYFRNLDENQARSLC